LPLRRATLFSETAKDDAPEAEGDARADDCDEEEERRLLYVGLTRAARRIFLTRAESRRIYGRLLKLPPSPFLEDIKNLCREKALVSRRHRAAKKLPLFP
jgi:superfamily I DNA/RNA helicase